MNNSSVVKAFNDHFTELIDDLKRVFPGNEDLLILETFVGNIRKVNPRLPISAWKECVSNVYAKEILSGDITFFLEKDYAADLEGNASSDYIINGIDKLRGPIKLLRTEDKMKSMKYIQNLTKLAAAF
jgi:hypothetical protein